MALPLQVLEAQSSDLRTYHYLQLPTTNLLLTAVQVLEAQSTDLSSLESVLASLDNDGDGTVDWREVCHAATQGSDPRLAEPWLAEPRQFAAQGSNPRLAEPRQFAAQGSNPRRAGRVPSRPLPAAHTCAPRPRAFRCGMHRGAHPAQPGQPREGGMHMHMQHAHAHAHARPAQPGQPREGTVSKSVSH